MSLFIGNLSSHIQREELEHEFGRFGKSYIRLKDGYGFVVYEAPEDAERALSALQGKNICGEEIFLTWSNRQPKPFWKFSRTNKFYEQHIGRNIRRGNYTLRNRDAYGRRDFVRHAANDCRTPPLLNASNQEVDDAIGKTGGIGSEKDRRSDNDLQAVRSHSGVTPENDQWGAPIHNMLGGDGLVNDTMFERYEPKYDFGSIVVEEKQKESGFSSSPMHIKSLDKGIGEHSIDVHLGHPENSKSKLVCYNRGDLGHVISNCPRGTDTRLEKFNKYRSGKDDDIFFRGREEHPMRRRARSWRRTNTTRELLRGCQAGGSRHSQSGERKRKRLMGREHLMVNNRSYQIKQMMEVQGGKRSKDCDSSTSKQHKERMRRSSSSYSHESISRLCLSGHSYHSFSRSSISISCSFRSSSSASPECRSVIHQSKSRSTLSVSKSLSSPSDMKTTLSMNDEANAANSFIPTGKQDHASGPRYGSILSAELEVSGANDEMDVEVVDTSLTARCLVHKEGLQDDYKASRLSTNYMQMRKDASLAELDKVSPISEKLQESIGEKADNEGSIPPIPSMHAVIGSDVQHCKSTNLSLQEIHVALKHYGLKAEDVCEQDLSVDSFFGGARLWPWQIIYYRRLKKGPISTENYAKRVAQTKEFGIIDKYV